MFVLKSSTAGLVIAIVLIGGFGTQDRARADAVDLSRAVVVVPDGLAGPEAKAVNLLVEEVKARSRIGWDVSIRWPSGAVPVIAVSPARLLGSFESQHRPQFTAEAAAAGKESYRIRTVDTGEGAPVIMVIGTDERGVLFGVGRLLRALRMVPGQVLLPERLNLSSAPRYPLRGHQLGYRPKTNSYDAWDLAQWERYIRELAVFGTNAVELIPPRSDDAATSPHFPLPPLEMMAGMSRICADYGLDVWIWYPAMDRDYADPGTVTFALKEWGDVFARLPRIDAVFVPGGDPGHTRPKVLLALLEKQAANLRRFHPKAQMWVSPQSFSREWLDEFLALLRAEPSWLGGIVYGPQVRVSLPDLRKAVPAKYPIRDYPDITHSLRCQYGVPDWDVAYSLTEGREVINPRPRDESAIFHAFAGQTIGSITYSEGCNDDVNKFVWSALGWDPAVDVLEVLRQYGSYLVGLRERRADDFAQGLLALEQNWRGPLLTNGSVESTLAQFRALERSASPAVLANWRFQQALYRAYYDAFVRSRLIFETDLEEQALGRLRMARAIGSKLAMDQAGAILNRAVAEPGSGDLRSRVFELAEALFQSIRMQLSVPRYKAISVGRGATLDTIDMPLNNRVWLERRFDAIRELASELARLGEIGEIVNWTNPGPGGFYDDLGDPRRRPHVVAGTEYEQDPARLHGLLTGFDQNPQWRRAWCRHGASLYDEPLRMSYTGLDRAAAYKVRVVYTGDMLQAQVRLTANDSIDVHPFLHKPSNMMPKEFDIPLEATRSGTLNLSWYAEAGRGGNGRGCQVSEVWLIKKGPETETAP
ncbi:MAG: hypothetical protein ACLQVF_16190 [Isosphaeraceae bacterium]